MGLRLFSLAKQIAKAGRTSQDRSAAVRMMKRIFELSARDVPAEFARRVSAAAVDAEDAETRLQRKQLHRAIGVLAETRDTWDDGNSRILAGFSHEHSCVAWRPSAAAAAFSKRVEAGDERAAGFSLLTAGLDDGRRSRSEESASAPEGDSQPAVVFRKSRPSVLSPRRHTPAPDAVSALVAGARALFEELLAVVAS